MGESGKENAVQAAIMGSLEVFCEDMGLQLFPPFANQQGVSLRKYCADLVGLLDDARIILLEIKELDCISGILPQFDSTQHAGYVKFYDLGVPIAYAYNAVPQLAYHQRPKPSKWAEKTLSQVNRSIPEALPGEEPDVPSHISLIDWLREAKGSEAVKLFGKVLGAIDASDLRNGMLVLLHGVSMGKLAALTSEEIQEVVKCLKNSSLKSSQRQRLQEILGESSQVLADFSSSISVSRPKGP